MIAGLVGGALVWLAVSPTAALVIGRMCRYRDRQVPR